MKVDKDGVLVELDPKKTYIMFIKASSRLSAMAREGRIKMENGRIYIVNDLNEVRFIENSDRIADVVIDNK